MCDGEYLNVCLLILGVVMDKLKELINNYRQIADAGFGTLSLRMLYSLVLMILLKKRTVQFLKEAI